MVSDDGSLPKGSIWSEWKQLFAEAGEKTGQTFDIIDDDRWVAWLEAAGFGAKGIETRTIKVPIGAWPAEAKWKEVGMFNRQALESGLEGFSLYILTNVMGWEYTEVQLWLARVRAALKNRSYHSYATW